jgi:serine/threonine protein phosphatase 1
MKYFCIGDIHGMLLPLRKVLADINKVINRDDLVIFCGDYIDRGEDSFAVVEMLVKYSTIQASIFLMGNHEVMLRDYLRGGREERSLYFMNGGQATIKSYTAQLGSFYIPEAHKEVLFSDQYYYETDSFVAVHAGFDPETGASMKTDPYDMVWIRETFFKTDKKWNKTIVFGHTPTQYMGKRLGEVYYDEEKNIFGIDTGAVYGGKLTCLIMPDKKIIQG